MAKQRRLIAANALRQRSQIICEETEESSTQTSVIFDPESLMLDPMSGIEYGLRQTMCDLSIEIPPEWFAQHWTPRVPFMETLTALLGTDDPQRISEATLRYFEHYNSTGRFMCTLRPGSMELLVRLSRNPRFDLHYLTHIGAHSAFRLLDAHGLRPLVPSVITPEEPGCPGIRPALMQYLVEHEGRSRESWVLLSDHPWELLAAKQLNLPSIALAYGRASVRNLCGLAPGAVASSPGEVEETLDALTTWRDDVQSASEQLRVH